MGRAHGAQCLEMSKEWTHVGGRGGGGVDAVVGGSPVATFKIFVSLFSRPCRLPPSTTGLLS